MSLTSSLAYIPKPTSVSARSFSTQCNTINGTTFGGGEQVKIDISTGQYGQYLDPLNSFLKFKITNNSGQTYTLDGNCASLFNRVVVEYAGYVLEDISDFGVLHSIMFDNQISFAERRTVHAITTGCNTTDQSRGGGSLADGASAVVTLALPSFILGLMATKYIPLGAMTADSNLRLTLYLNDAGIGVVCGNGHTGTFSLSDITYEAHMVKLEESAEAMVRQSTKGVYRIHGESYRAFNTTLESGVTQSTINIPVKVSSLKTLIVCHRYSSDTTNVEKASITNRTRGDLSEYFFSIGNMRVPQKPIKVNGGCAEAFVEVQKALHHFGSRNSAISYTAAQYIKTSTSDTDGSFVIMLDTEGFSGKSDVINTGMSTISQNVFFNGTYLTTPAQITVTSYAHFDTMLESTASDGLARVMF